MPAASDDRVVMADEMVGALTPLFPAGSPLGAFCDALLDVATAQAAGPGRRQQQERQAAVRDLVVAAAAQLRDRQARVRTLLEG